MVVEPIEIIVVQRQTLDWHNISMMDFREESKAFCRLWSKPEDYAYRLAQLWDNTFSENYLNTRACLKDIALNNLQAIPDVRIISYAQYTNVPDTYGFYVPVDDDDWLSPTISKTLAGCSPAQHPMLLWRSANIGSPQQEHPVFIWGLNGRCMTNNYAVSSVWLDSLRHLPRIVQHKGAVHMLEKLKNDGATVLQLDCALSVSNKSPISSVSLDNGLAGDLTSPRLIALVEAYLEKMNKITVADIAWIPWVKQPLDATILLFQRVFNSQK